MKTTELKEKYKGWTSNQFLNLDYSEMMTMKRPELAYITGRLSLMANKRIKRLENSSTDSPALKALKKNGNDLFGVKGKDRNEILSEYTKIKTFSNYKTSTVRGAIKVKKAYFEKYGKMNKEQEDKFWNVYNRLLETRSLYNIKEVSSMDTQKEVQGLVIDNMEKDIDEMVKLAELKFDDMMLEVSRKLHKR